MSVSLIKDRQALDFELFKYLRNKTKETIECVLRQPVRANAKSTTLDATNKILPVELEKLHAPETGLEAYAELRGETANDYTRSAQDMWTHIVYNAAMHSTRLFEDENLTRGAQAKQWSLAHTDDCNIAVTVTLNSWTYYLAGYMTDTEFNIIAAKKAINLHNSRARSHETVDPASRSAFKLA